MEGVLLVDVHSGALVFTRSFTDAFDLRHPRTERMNLSALLFALLSFAGTCDRFPTASHYERRTDGWKVAMQWFCRQQSALR